MIGGASDADVGFLLLPVVTWLVHEAPLHAGGEAGSSSATEPRDFHLVYDPVRSLQHDFLGLVPVSSPHGALESVRKRDEPAFIVSGLQELRGRLYFSCCVVTSSHSDHTSW